MKGGESLPVQVASRGTTTKTEDETELRAIFEGQCFDEGNKFPSRSENVLGADNEDEGRHEVKPMLSSTTLKSVKNRLKKTFLSDSSFEKKIDKRRSIGMSEVEVERRKELRRLRQKRIEEELSLEDEYDDDAQTMSTVEGPNAQATDKKGKKRHSILPEDSGNFPVFRK